MNKKILLLMAFATIGTTTFGKLNYHTSEIESKYNVHNDRGEVLFRLGEGSYQINDTWSLYYDVTKSHIMHKDQSNQELEYQEFTLNQYLPINETWYLYTTYQYIRNSWWTNESRNYGYNNLYYASAYFGRDLNIADKKWYFGVKLDQQIGGSVEASFSNYLAKESATGINFFMGRQFTDNLKLDLSNYHLALYDNNAKDMDYFLKGEMTLEHTLPIKGDLSLLTELYVEASRTYKKDNRDGMYKELYLLPQVQYKKEIKDKVKAYVSVGYEVVSYGYSMWSKADQKGWKNNNEIIAKAGFTYTP